MIKRLLQSGQTQGDLFADAPLLPETVSDQKPKTKRATRKKTAPEEVKDPRFFSVDIVAERYGVGASTIWRWVADDSNFPAPLKLAKGTTRWTESQLLAFENAALRKAFANKKTTFEGKTKSSVKVEKS